MFDFKDFDLKLHTLNCRNSFRGTLFMLSISSHILESVAILAQVCANLRSISFVFTCSLRKWDLVGARVGPRHLRWSCCLAGTASLLVGSSSSLPDLLASASSCRSPCQSSLLRQPPLADSIVLLCTSPLRETRLRAASLIVASSPGFAGFGPPC